MLFNSLAFVVFFPIVVTLYFLLPPRFGWALLQALTRNYVKPQFNRALIAELTAKGYLP